VNLPRPPGRGGRAPAEGVSWTIRRGRYDAPLLLTEFPDQVAFGFLGQLLATSTAIECRFQAHRIPPERATELVHAAGVVAETELATNSGSSLGRPAQWQLESESAQELARQVAAREQELWRFGLSLHTFGGRPERARELRGALVRKLQGFGFRSRIPSYESFDVVRAADLAGTESRPPGYWHTIHTDGLAAFFPFHDELVAESGGILVGFLRDEDTTPIFLDRWSQASYSWAIFGATGSGKTYTAALWALRSRWMRPDLDLIVVDPLGEFSRFVRELGGTVVALRSSEAGRVNPLDPVTTAGDLEEKASRLTTMLSALFPSLRDEEAATIDAALHDLLARSGDAPTFSDLIAEIERRGPRGRLSDLLEIFRSGSLQHLNGPTTLTWQGSPFSFDLSGIPSHQLPFYLSFSLDALYARLKDRPGPKLVVVDEAHLLTRDERTSEFLERLVRLVRHFDTGLLLLSQNPDDFLVHENGRALSRNLRATLFLRVGSVSNETRDFFGLTEGEADWLPRARLPREAGYAEGLLRSGGDHLVIGIVASTREHDLLSRTLGGPDPSNVGPSAESTGTPRTVRL
jgi:hypothetical protein